MPPSNGKPSWKKPHEKKTIHKLKTSKTNRTKILFLKFYFGMTNNINKAHITLENPVYLRAQP